MEGSVGVLGFLRFGEDLGGGSETRVHVMFRSRIRDFVSATPVIRGDGS